VDPAAFGRNYFGRASADEADTYEEAEERAQVHADVAKLIDLATDFSDVNKPLVVHPAIFGRGYSVETKTVEDADECAAVLDDAVKLKKSARSYFPRDSAEGGTILRQAIAHDEEHAAEVLDTNDTDRSPR